MPTDPRVSTPPPQTNVSESEWLTAANGVPVSSEYVTVHDSDFDSWLGQAFVSKSVLRLN
jgi:hypothetical protein